jgi:hypothetical protein
MIGVPHFDIVRNDGSIHHNDDVPVEIENTTTAFSGLDFHSRSVSELAVRERKPRKQRKLRKPDHHVHKPSLEENTSFSLP